MRSPDGTCIRVHFGCRRKMVHRFFNKIILFQTKNATLHVQYFYGCNCVEDDYAQIGSGLQTVEHVCAVLLQVARCHASHPIRHPLDYSTLLIQPRTPPPKHHLNPAAEPPTPYPHPTHP